ncbi:MULTISPECIES: retropepsin-like aspartic protease [unclassified Tenacibaculum]|uniref:retropepsin-like aspartic protease n=1 Tax=unclassified Tenacibaculum TaxID=2635139 RepID=UPI001F24A573|nr:MULTISPECIES: retropepsin-like aspartic protease [unclassified Tenacibaculum]MCF2876571.1 retroviral-like aspartic protease family protein [Tenacibaculum sp. Cn5-1]MCF2936522.1 retroviral-like aspartic protease family protein [Tenacibaculum sp. Cn5-34]MCG7511885.1 retroviral-like aspartic protease family protein [Tenacibaculum sp. Cn5-46]
MKKIIKISLLFIVVFLCACKPSSKKEESVESQKFNLESYLIKDEYVKLELKKMSSGHLHIYGLLNGVKGNFILDTGAGATVIDKKNKEKFHMKAVKSEDEGTGAGGTGLQMLASEKNNFRIGGLEMDELGLTLMSLDHVNKAFESMGLEEIDGVIGADILTNKKAIIDYSNLILYLKK